MSRNFLPWHNLWLKDRRTWAMHQGGREVCSRTNYILGTESCLFHNIAVRDARHNTDHYLVMVFLYRAVPVTLPREAYTIPHQSSDKSG